MRSGPRRRAGPPPGVASSGGRGSWRRRVRSPRGTTDPSHDRDADLPARACRAALPPRRPGGRARRRGRRGHGRHGVGTRRGGHRTRPPGGAGAAASRAAGRERARAWLPALPELRRAAAPPAARPGSPRRRRGRAAADDGSGARCREDGRGAARGRHAGAPRGRRAARGRDDGAGRRVRGQRVRAARRGGRLVGCTADGVGRALAEMFTVPVPAAERVRVATWSEKNLPGRSS